MIKERKLTKTNFADLAEDAMRTYVRNNKKIITTSQIRNILSMITTLGEQSKRKKDKKLSEEEKVNLQYIKMRIAYESGRAEEVSSFFKETSTLDYLNELIEESDSNDARDKLNIFYNYFESLVAYHKFYGGRE